jgi:hypothetical protein
MASVMICGKEMPAPGAEQEHRRQEVDDELALHRQPRHPQQGQRDQRQPAEQHRARAEPEAEPGGDEEREHADADRHGQEGEADLDRVVAQDALQVERAEEEHAEQPGDEQHQDHVRAGDVAGAEQAQRQQRLGGDRLAGQEERHQRDRDCALPQRLRRAPAVAAGLDDGVHAEHQRARDQRRTEHVGAVAQAQPRLVLEEPPGQHGGGDADRHVDEEDPVPGDRLGEDAAGQQADRGARGGDERVDADRLRLLPGLREHRHDHAEDDGGGHGAADALEEARTDQQPLAGGQAAEQ